ncbi:MAG TPA: DUF6119 family protein [Pyrinomonadaceae bacterium]|nr:DUF6119 family protein [Pyrinomonadaceae bacterium]
MKDGETVIGDLYVKKPRPKSPGWGKFFRDYVDPKELGKTSSTAAVLVIRIENRWFAITFGQGRFLLEPESWEESFGLLVTLNSVAQDRIKSIDKRTFDALSTHSKVQTSQEAAPQDFGLDVEQDLVRAVVGSPDNSELGHRLSGMDALRTSVSVALEQLPDLLERYQTQFHSKAYQKNFPWVDHISEVTRASQKEELDNLLVEQIRAANLERCWMAVPEIVDWASIDGFRYGWSKKNPKRHDIHLNDFFEEVRDPAAITIENLRQRQVYGIGDDDRQLYQWSVYKCIYCELDLRDESYLLSGGKWYRVTRDFVTEVNDSFARIPRYEVALPEYDDDSEGEYNERVADGGTGRFALMDRKIISFGGGKFEFCDLYTREKDIIHVKRYGGSSIFSHLFAQGTASGELFQTQPAFRDLVNQRLPLTHKLTDCAKRPDSREYQIVFAVVSDSDEADLTIPFFSRLNLRSAVRRLDGYGFRVAIAKVSVSRTRSKLKRYGVD